MLPASKVYLVGYSSKIQEFEAVFYFSYIKSVLNDILSQMLLVWTQKVAQQSLVPYNLV